MEFAQRFTRLALLLAVGILPGCIGSRAVEAPDVYLSPAGWQDNQKFLENETFAGYAEAVKEEVRRYRIPFDATRAEAEIELVAPIELPLSNHCSGRASGIAILVHGLSDTAYALRDIGGVLADVCFKSRVILLPGHGTRAGDLLTTRLTDWQRTIDYLIDQAAEETDTLLLVGFSLGGVLTLDAAVKRQDAVDGIIGISPAYSLSSARIARWAPVVVPVMRWVDRGVADDPMRYEAMPMRGVAETWTAMKAMERSLDNYGPVRIPWMLTHSMDDAVVVPEQNERLWKTYAENPDSQLIRFVSDEEYPEGARILNLPGNSKADRVIALTHLAIHQSPDNPHYGRSGRYRNCGGNMPREGDGVSLCEQSDKVWYGLWSTEPVPNRPMAYSTFNPSFDELAAEIREFAERIVEHERGKS